LVFIIKHCPYEHKHCLVRFLRHHQFRQEIVDMIFDLIRTKSEIISSTDYDD
jgi:hypothetical protein